MHPSRRKGEKMIEFILANMTEIISLLVALFFFGYAIFTKQWGLVKSSALSFMLSAERLMKTKNGQRRMEEVYISIYARLPLMFRKFITEEKLQELLQKWYDEGKDALKG